MSKPRPQNLRFKKKALWTGLALLVIFLSSIYVYQNPSSSSYQFSDPNLAYKILRQLDTFEPVDPSYVSGTPGGEDWYHKPNLGLINDDEYCDKHRAAFVKSPEIVFDQKNYWLERRSQSVMRIVKETGTDMMPNVGRNMPEAKKKQFLYKLKSDINMFFSTATLHRYKHVGLHWGCLSQELNHIPGHYTFKNKDLFPRAVMEYAKKYEDRPQCFSYDKYFPKTWILSDKESCHEFFKQLNTPEHSKLLDERQIVHVKKVVNSHRGVGVTALRAADEEAIKEEYKNGALCGKNDENVIVQNFIHNPLLLNGKKFDFRMYLLIASTNPLIVYYHDGDLRVTLYDYDINSGDKKVLFTNLDLNKEIYDEARKGNHFNGLDEEGLMHAQQWTFPRLQAHLLAEGVITDPNWLDNYLRPEFKKAIAHITRIVGHKFLRRSSVYELYGTDFMLDTDMNLWFIEANSGPMFDGSSKEVDVHIMQMLGDHFDIMFGLLRSRMKRVVLLVNEIIATGQVKKLNKEDVTIKNVDKWRKEFDKASMNYFEPEYEPKPDNSYSKVVDENYEGVERYMNFIDAACL